MPRFIDLTGKRFGRLTVVERANKPGEGSSPTWLCKCDCGNTKIINGKSLRNGTTVSCGCWQRENSPRNMTRTHKDAKMGMVAGTNISHIKTHAVYRNNTTGHTGVYARRGENGQIKYRAAYQLQGKMHILGTFDTIEEAARVRDKAVEAARAPILEAYQKGTMERRCAVCGNVFMPNNARQITCSHDCARKRHNAQVAAYQRSKYIRNKAPKKKAVTEREAATMERIPCVYYRSGRWIAVPKNQYIGSFDTQEEAAAAVEQYKADHPEYKPHKRYDAQEGTNNGRDPNLDKSPIPYVHYAKKRWVASPNSKYIGSFDTQEEAAEAVEKYKADHPEFKPRAKRRRNPNE